jgi:hypothetical protein
MNKSKLKENTFVFSTLFVIFYVLVKNAIQAPFTVEDEYNNFYWANPNHLFGPEASYLQTLFHAVRGFIFQGRLLVIHLIVIVGRAKIFGINPTMHHWTVFLFGLGTAFFIYRLFVKASFSKINSYLGSLIYISGYTYAEIFFRLSSGECTGNLFLVISIYFVVSFIKDQKNVYIYWSIIFAFIAALSKESYVILFPLIFAIPFLFLDTNQWKSFIIQHIKQVYIIAISFLILVLFLYFTIKSSGIVFSYGKPLSTFDTVVNNTLWIFKWFVAFMPLVIIAAFDFLRKNNIRSIVPILIFSFGWIISQLVIYNKVIISFSQGRYMMPAGLIFIFFIVIALEHFKQYPKGYWIAFVLVFSLIIRNSKIVYINANEFEARATAFNNLINKLVEINQDKIAVYGGVEFFQSINTHFKYKNYTPQLVTTPVVYKKDFYNEYNDANYKDKLQNDLNQLHVFKTLTDLKNDSSVNIMVTAEPEEYLPVNYDEIMKTFTKVEKVAVKFSNPGFGDLLKKDFWIGNLKNSERSYLVFTK